MFRIPRIKATISILACLAAAEAANGQADLSEFDFRQLRLPWTSTNSNPADVSRQVAELYIALFNSENLPIRTVSVDSVASVSELAYELGFFSGSYFPDDLDALLCDLNSHICSRELTEYQGDPFAEQSRHIGGYAISRGNWKFSPGDSLNVIDLDLYGTLEFVPRVIPEGKSIADVLENDGLDCSQFAASCAEIVRFLNPDIKDIDAPSDGVLAAVLPTRRVSTYIPIKEQAAVDELLDRYEFVAMPEEAGSIEGFEFRGADQAAPKPPTLVTDGINQLEKNLYLKGGAGRLDSDFDNLHPGGIDLFRYTGHPYGSLQGTIGDLVTASVNIGVIDNWIDAEHCHLIGKVDVIGSLTPRTVNRSSQCYEESSGDLSSHGTHVVGAITGGGVESKFIGLYPQSHVIFAGVNVDQLGVAEVNRAVGTDLIGMSYVNQVQVVNASWEYTTLGDNDPIFTSIQAIGNVTLIVASAGNSAQSRSRNGRGCIWDPACLSRLPNVISVVGLTADLDSPEVYEKDNVAASGSNYGTAFDIAAVGENVFSTVNGDGIGPMSGTSQAAPQVTAAAGLLHAVFRETFLNQSPPSPSKIKNRLMYSADIFPHLLESVYSGRLNIGRALAISSSHVVFDDLPGQTFSGAIIEHPDHIQCRVGDVQIDVPWSDLRRLKWNELSNSLVVFYEERVQQSAFSYFELKRIPNCVLLTQTNAFHFDVPGEAQLIERQLNDIRDLLVRM